MSILRQIKTKIALKFNEKKQAIYLLVSHPNNIPYKNPHDMQIIEYPEENKTLLPRSTVNDF